MALLAHGGHGAHWATSLIYVVPIIMFGLWVLVSALRDRRRLKRAAEVPGDAPPLLRSESPPDAAAGDAHHG